MKKISGKTVCKGIVMGPVAVIKKTALQTAPRKISDPEREIRRFLQARDAAAKQLEELYEKAVPEVGKTDAAVFRAHRLMIEDENFSGAVLELIRKERINAEYAAAEVGKQFSAVFAGLDDEYMKARQEDIRDITWRLVQILNGNTDKEQQILQPSVIISEELNPSQIMGIDRKNILAIVLTKGSAVSHAAILAGMRNIPMVIRVPLNLEELKCDMTVIVDGTLGEVVIDPTKEISIKVKERIEQENQQRRQLHNLIGKENTTLQGRKVDVFANISGPEDVRAVLENDAGGIGLFRSEFIYLEGNDWPTEEVQFQTYRQVLQDMEQKRVVIRTLDLGDDKQVPYLNQENAETVVSDCRGIRFCLQKPEIFKTQLRALFRAAVYGKLSIMYPMISSVEELEEISEIVKEVQNELEEAELPYETPEQGIMIETPEAVQLSSELSQKADFFSIGTNDLTRYLKKANRNPAQLEEVYDLKRKVLHIIRVVTENAHKYGKKVGICGEMAADLEITEELIELGIDEFSVVPSVILPLRKRIREIP